MTPVTRARYLDMAAVMGAHTHAAGLSDVQISPAAIAGILKDIHMFPVRRRASKASLYSRQQVRAPLPLRFLRSDGRNRPSIGIYSRIGRRFVRGQSY